MLLKTLKYVGRDVHKNITLIVLLNETGQVESRSQVRTKIENFRYHYLYHYLLEAELVTADGFSLVFYSLLQMAHLYLSTDGGRPSAPAILSARLRLLEEFRRARAPWPSSLLQQQAFSLIGQLRSQIRFDTSRVVWCSEGWSNRAFAPHFKAHLEAAGGRSGRSVGLQRPAPRLFRATTLVNNFWPSHSSELSITSVR